MLRIISLILLLNSYNSFSKNDTIVSMFVHINNENNRWDDVKIISFKLECVDLNEKVIWKSTAISEFECEFDSDGSDKKTISGFIVKVDLPKNIVQKGKKFWCTATVMKPISGGSMDAFVESQVKYGGVKLSNIRLNICSKPNGAETYLIPKHVWDLNLISLSSEQQLLKYKVNTSKTNTYTYIDETVYVVLCKLKNELKYVIHYTKPEKTQAVQTIEISF